MIYSEKDYGERGISEHFIEDDFSVSAKNVLRGIHCDSKAWKLISCLSGRVYLVIVNCDKSNKFFGKWESFVISPENGVQVLVPPRHGIAHLVLSDKAVFHYKSTQYYDPSRQETFLWNDKRFKIWWPTKIPNLSQRDEVGKYV